MNWTLILVFILEFMMFIMTGVALYWEFYIGAMFWFVLGLVLASYAGKLIQEDAVKKYKRENGIKKN